MSEKLSKYIAAFDYFDKTLIEERSIISFTSVIGVPAGVASSHFSLVFSWTTGIIKKLFKINNK